MARRRTLRRKLIKSRNKKKRKTYRKTRKMREAGMTPEETSKMTPEETSILIELQLISNAAYKNSKEMNYTPEAIKAEKLASDNYQKLYGELAKKYYVPDPKTALTDKEKAIADIYVIHGNR